MSLIKYLTIYLQSFGPVAHFQLFYQALERGYKVDFCEPDTSWKFDPYELEKYEFLILPFCAGAGLQKPLT